MDLEGRTALVTGAGRGLGRAVAVELARRGARVALVSRTRSELDEAAAAIRGAGGSAHAITCDLERPNAAGDLLEQLRREFGDVDVLINNAAIVEPLGATAQLQPGMWAATIQINLIAPVALAMGLLAGLIARGWGRIINVSSGVAASPAVMVGGNAYSTSKAGLEAHTVSLASELDGTGVTANVFRPGVVDTSMQRWIRTQDPQRIGVGLSNLFNQMHDDRILAAPEGVAENLANRITGDSNGQIWDVYDDIA